MMPAARWAGLREGVACVDRRWMSLGALGLSGGLHVEHALETVHVRAEVRRHGADEAIIVMLLLWQMCAAGVGNLMWLNVGADGGRQERGHFCSLSAAF